MDSVGRTTAFLLGCFEAPTDGLAEGVSAASKFDQMLDVYYEAMGWDKMGKPLSETLYRLGLDMVVKDLAR